jgi:hypothetical protein
MRDRTIIWTALALFLGLITLPVWRNLSAGVTSKGPNPVLPAKEKQCVAPLSYMKSSHMRLLLDWRETVVRGNRREFVTADGRHYNMSLTSTCLKQCHGAKADFCDRCHNYAMVSAPCWTCHVDSRPQLWSAR